MRSVRKKQEEKRWAKKTKEVCGVYLNTKRG